MTKDVYDELADWLVTTFRCLPEVRTPEFMNLLYHLYTPEEARLALQVGPEGGKMDTWAEKTGMSKEDLKPLMESMAQKGTIFVEPGEDDPLYRPLYVEAPGIAETSGWGDLESPFIQKKMELWGKFKPIYVNEGVAPLPKHVQAWCAVSALPPDAKPEENLYTQIKELTDYIAVLPCPCRLWERQLGDPDDCECLSECCFSFNEHARWHVEQGNARRLTYDEAIDILKTCEEKGQVNAGDSTLQLCSCCRHSCINSYAMKFDKSHSYVKNHFLAVVDPEACISCEICVDRCRVNAVHLDDIAVIDEDECVGCGACAVGCEVDAIKMVRRSEEEIARLEAEAHESWAKLAQMTKLDPYVLELYGLD